MKRLVATKSIGEKDVSYSLFERENTYHIEICENICIKRAQVCFGKSEMSVKKLRSFFKKICKEELEAMHLSDVTEDFRNGEYSFF